MSKKEAATSDVVVTGILLLNSNHFVYYLIWVLLIHLYPPDLPYN